VSFLTSLISAQELNDVADLPEDFLKSKDFEIVTVKAGDTIPVTKTLTAHVVSCVHGVPTVGYGFVDKRKKLKAEYQALPSSEVGKLRKSGVEVQEEVNVLQFCFLGDTTTEVFKLHPELLTYPIVIIECSFLLPEHENQAASSNHVHWTLLAPIVKAHPKTTFVLIHFSLRYRVRNDLN